MYNSNTSHSQSCRMRWRLTIKKLLMAVASLTVLTVLLQTSYEYGRISQGTVIHNRVPWQLANSLDRFLRFQNLSKTEHMHTTTPGKSYVARGLNVPFTPIEPPLNPALIQQSEQKPNSTAKSPIQDTDTKLVNRDRQSIDSSNNLNVQLAVDESAATRPTTYPPVPPSYTPFDYIISNSDLCYKEKPQVLVWIYSAPKNFVRRRAIRETWGNASLYSPVKVLFVFSLAVVQDKSLTKNIDSEQTTYRDIVQDGSFIDAYRNLTYKAQSMLKWTTAYCTDIKLLFKVDDDSFLIPKRLSKWLRQFKVKKTWPTNSIIGTLWKNRKPARRGKWASTVKEFSGERYAKTSCPGSGYMISGDLVPKLKDAITKVQFLWLEDMYTTGLLSEHVGGVSYTSNAQHHVLLLLITETRVQQYTENRDLFLFGHVGTEKRIYKFWNYAKKFPS